jgi:hypothetical protein
MFMCRFIYFSKRKAAKSGVSDSTKFLLKNFWKADLKEVSVVMIFGLDEVMPRLSQKLTKELKPGSYVISNNFQIPNWKPIAVEEDMWLYKIIDKL